MECLVKWQSAKTVQSIIRYLSSLMSHAVGDEFLMVSPALKPSKFPSKIIKH